jgi:Na+-translocating ferredoxin:NAD+ oxidoreductase subunit D
MNELRNQHHLKLTVTASPHLVAELSTSRIMVFVAVALLPALVASTYYFGLRVLAMTGVCIVSSVVLEYIFNMILKRQQTVGDYSAVVTGMLIAFNLPSNFPYTMAIVGCFVAIVVVKQLFGGIGQNIVNPAIAARVVLLVSFPVEMTSWPVPNPIWQSGTQGPDAVTAATPLTLWQQGESLPSNLDLFLGNVGGSMAEVSAIAILIGFGFLLYKKVVSPLIPVSFIGTVFLFAVLAGEDPIFQILAGGVMLGACFMATDYVTSPVLPLGQIIFGVGCGLITMAIRLFGNFPEGVSFAILFMNLIAPQINAFCNGMIVRKYQRRGQ